jgi:hypothetical protein
LNNKIEEAKRKKNVLVARKKRAIKRLQDERDATHGLPPADGAGAPAT